MPPQPSRIIVVTGATGAQGGAVIVTLLSNSPPLAFPIHIRGTTRNTSSPASQALILRGIEMVEADFSDPRSLSAAFADAWAIFAVTDFWERFGRDPSDPSAATEQDYAHGVNLARAAAAVSSLVHYIWSTEPHSSKLSCGRHLVPHFDGKARVDDFIRDEFGDSLFQMTTFLWVSFYAKNLKFLPMWKPVFDSKNGKYSIGVPVGPETRFASLGSLRNVGLAVAAILDGRQKSSSSSSRQQDRESCWNTLMSGYHNHHRAKYIAVNHGFISLRSYYEIWADVVVLRRSLRTNGIVNETGGVAEDVVADKHFRSDNGMSLTGDDSAQAKVEVEVEVEAKQIDPGEYEKLYGGFGREMFAMFDFWRDVGEERSWSVVGGDDGVVVSLRELLAPRGQRPVNLEESFRELAWDCA